MRFQTSPLPNGEFICYIVPTIVDLKKNYYPLLQVLIIAYRQRVVGKSGLRVELLYRFFSSSDVHTVSGFDCVIINVDLTTPDLEINVLSAKF